MKLEPGLYTLAEIPDFLRFNQYIHGGYRLYFTKLQCLKSIVIISNETVNIWSHLIGTIIFLYFTYQSNTFLTHFEKSAIQDHIIVTIFCLAFLSCLLFSSLFHIFNCYSKDSYEYCLRLDLVGISISLCGTYLPSIFYGFYCFKFWRYFYSGVVLLMIVMNILLQVCPRRIYTEKTDYKRIILFIVMVLFGIIPACHWIVLMGGISNPLVQHFIPQLMVMYTMCATAFFFYLSKIPERFLPGYCDYIGHSHQIWHLLILMCFLWWYSCSLDLVKIRLRNEHRC